MAVPEDFVESTQPATLGGPSDAARWLEFPQPPGVHSESEVPRSVVDVEDMQLIWKKMLSLLFVKTT